MSHVSSPVLRRLVDEPMAVPDRARRHLAGCDRCQAESAEIAGNAAAAARLLEAPPEISDVDLEWFLLAERLRQPDAARRPAVRNPWRMPRRLAGASLGAPAAVAAAVLAVGVGAAAALTIVYAPTRVAPVPVSPNDVQAIENLTGLNVSQPSGGLPASGSRQLAFGTLSWTTAGQARQVSSTARASALTHLAYSAPAVLPAGVGPPSSIGVQPQVTATVVFSRKAGPGIAGSTLEITGGPAMVVLYGSRPGRPGCPPSPSPSGSGRPRPRPERPPASWRRSCSPGAACPPGWPRSCGCSATPARSCRCRSRPGCQRGS